MSAFLQGPEPRGYIATGYLRVRQATMPRRKTSSTRNPVTQDSQATDPDKPGTAFDQWLDRGLHELFDSVAEEPLPESLLKLLEEDKKE